MNSMNRRSFIGGALALTTLVLAGCGGSATATASSSGVPASKPAGSAPASAKPAASGSAAASPAGSAKPAAPGTANAVKGAWVAITANQMLWPLAVEAGYFDKYGVNFALQYVQGSVTSVQALVAGDLQMVEVAGSAVAAAQATKTDLVMVAGFLNQTVWRIMGIPSVTSIDQLKGATVAISKVGNADYFAWPILAEHQGWKATDFKYAPGGNPPGQIALMSRGDAQASAFSPPNDVLAKNKIGAHLVVDEATFKVPEQQVGMALSKAYIAKNRATTLNVLKATIEAIHRWKTDPAFAKTVIKKYLKTTDAAVIDNGYSAYAPLFPEVPYPTVKGFAGTIAEVATQNPKVKGVTPEQCIDASLVKELVDSGFIKQIYGSSAAASGAAAAKPAASSSGAASAKPAASASAK